MTKGGKIEEEILNAMMLDIRAKHGESGDESDGGGDWERYRFTGESAEGEISEDVMDKATDAVEPFFHQYDDGYDTEMNEGKIATRSSSKQHEDKNDKFNEENIEDDNAIARALDPQKDKKRLDRKVEKESQRIESAIAYRAVVKNMKNSQFMKLGILDRLIGAIGMKYLSKQGMGKDTQFQRKSLMELVTMTLQNIRETNQSATTMEKAGLGAGIAGDGILNEVFGRLKGIGEVLREGVDEKKGSSLQDMKAKTEQSHVEQVHAHAKGEQGKGGGGGGISGGCGF